MNITQRLFNKIGINIIKNKIVYGIISGIFILVSIILFTKGIIPMASIPMQSVSGGVFGRVAINIGLVIAVLGALIVFYGVINRRAGGKPSFAFSVLGWTLLVGGGLLTGASFLDIVKDFFLSIGILGQIILGLIVFVIFSKVI